MPTHFISLSEAIEMTTHYRENMETILDSNYQNQEILALSETFTREAFDTLLAQDGCEKLRIYFGMDGDLKVHAIIVGVDTHDEDMLPAGANGFEIVESGYRCPSDCPPSSDLNT